MFFIFAIGITIVIVIIITGITKQKYKKLESEVLQKLGFSNWNIISYIDERITVKSRQALEKYDDIKFFKENRKRLCKRATKIDDKETARVYQKS